MVVSSIEQIQRLLETDETDTERLRSLVRKRMADIHPDRNGGNFKTTDDEKLFQRLNESMELLDAPPTSTAMVSIDVVTDLINAVKQNPAGPSTVDIQQQSLSETLESSLSRYRNRSFLPRLSLAILSGAMTLVWLFPNTVTGHPVLNKWIDVESPIFGMNWMLLVSLTGFLWITHFFRDQARTQFTSLLKTDEVQSSLFDLFVKERAGSSFTSVDFARFLQSYEISSELRHIGRSTLRVLPPPFSVFLEHAFRIDHETAGQLAAVIISRAKSMKLIDTVPAPSLSETFRIAGQIEEHE